MSSPSPPESPSSKLSLIKSAVLSSDYCLCNIQNDINELKSDVKIIQNYLENINSTLDTLTQSTNSDHQEENKLDQILQSIQQLNATIPGPEPCGAYKVYELLNEGDVIPHKTECDNYITGRIFRKTFKYIEYYTDPVPNKRQRNILRRGDKAIITDKENPLCNNIITVKRNENTKIYFNLSPDEEKEIALNNVSKISTHKIYFERVKRIIPQHVTNAILTSYSPIRTLPPIEIRDHNLPEVKVYSPPTDVNNPPNVNLLSRDGAINSLTFPEGEAVARPIVAIPDTTTTTQRTRTIRKKRNFEDMVIRMNR